MTKVEDWSDEEVLAELDRIKKHGHGTLTVKVTDHRVSDVELLIRKRKAARASDK
ncbi:hypothetical protein [Candidatus Nitrospira bockiana]